MNLYLNGEYMPLDRGRVPVEDRGFQFADGVYEVLRVYHGSPFRLPEHLARLERSLAGLEIPLPEPVPKIAEVCRRVAEGIPEATVYLQVTRGAAPRTHEFPSGIRPTFLAYAREVRAYAADRTFILRSVPDDRWGRCHLKTIALLANILGRQKARQAGADEGLFVRPDGSVTEGTGSNAFLVRGGAVRTHPADHRILSGVTRDAVVRLSRDLGIPLEEKAFTLAEALGADELFVTGTTAEVMPVSEVDGRRIGAAAPGPVTSRLRTAFRELVRRESGIEPLSD